MTTIIITGIIIASSSTSSGTSVSFIIAIGAAGIAAAQGALAASRRSNIGCEHRKTAYLAHGEIFAAFMFGFKLERGFR